MMSPSGGPNSVLMVVDKDQQFVSKVCISGGGRLFLVDANDFDQMSGISAKCVSLYAIGTLHSHCYVCTDSQDCSMNV